MLSFSKHDAYGQVLKPGDVCVYQVRDRGPRFCIYKREVQRSMKGQYGRFITDKGIVSLKFSSVIFAFDPMSDKRAQSIKPLIRSYYEDTK